MHKVNASPPFHRHHLPYRDYTRADVQLVKENENYGVDAEVWPTNTVLEANATLALEIAGHDTRGVGKCSHEHPDDRNSAISSRPGVWLSFAPSHTSRRPDN